MGNIRARGHRPSTQATGNNIAQCPRKEINEAADKVKAAKLKMLIERHAMGLPLFDD